MTTTEPPPPTVPPGWYFRRGRAWVRVDHPRKAPPRVRVYEDVELQALPDGRLALRAQEAPKP